MPEFIDPNQFVISRKRKKYRFAKFHNSPLCFELAEWQPRAVDCIEIGAGNGMFLVEQAALSPDKTFLAVDVKGDRLQIGAYAAAARGLTNVFFVRARADQLLEFVPAGSVAAIWLTFSDPYPKKRSAGRRLTHPYFLALYKTALRAYGDVYMKHDNPDFFAWSLEQFVANGWRLTELSFDLHSSDLDGHYKVMTAYEQKWLALGLRTQFVHATIDETPH